LDKQDDGVGEGFGRLRPAVVLGGLDAEIGHLLLDHARITPLGARQQHLTGDRQQQLSVEALSRTLPPQRREREEIPD